MLSTNRRHDRATTGAKLRPKRPGRREPRRQPRQRDGVPERPCADKLVAAWFKAEMSKTPAGQNFLRRLDGLAEIEVLAALSSIVLAGAERADGRASREYTAARAGTAGVDDQTAGWRFREAHGRLERARARHAGLQDRRGRAVAELEVAGRWI
jgi:hypothetical protein